VHRCEWPVAGHHPSERHRLVGWYVHTGDGYDHPRVNLGRIKRRLGP
jgi:hypothetical protein